jgi:hypothetical protein
VRSALSGKKGRLQEPYEFPESANILSSTSVYINKKNSKPATSVCNQEDKENSGYIFAASPLMLFHSSAKEDRLQLYKVGLTPRQQLATCCLQHFLVMLPVITKKCCRQHVANCCLGVRPPLVSRKCPNFLSSTSVYIKIIIIID